MLLHALTKKVNLKEEAVKADARYDHAGHQFLLALLKWQQRKRRLLLCTPAGRGRRLARGSVRLALWAAGKTLQSAVGEAASLQRGGAAGQPDFHALI